MPLPIVPAPTTPMVLISVAMPCALQTAAVSSTSGHGGGDSPACRVEVSGEARGGLGAEPFHAEVQVLLEPRPGVGGVVPRLVGDGPVFVEEEVEVEVERVRVEAKAVG